MNGKNINSEDKKIKKSEFYKNKKLNNIDVDKILVSKKESYGIKNSFKYFMTGYAKKFDKNVTMSFRVNNKQLLKNYNKILEKFEKVNEYRF